MKVIHPGRAMWRGLAAGVICAATAVLVGGCSSAEYPSQYPTIFADPTPRDDQPMTPDQVKQASDNLASDRSQLSTQAQAVQAAGADLGPPPPPGTPPAATAAKP
jgi:hypothetical protein